MPLFRNRFAAALAALALALQGFWPLLSQARPADQSLFGALCSVDGAKAADSSGGTLPAGGAGHGKHCALCVAGGDRAAALAGAPATGPSLAAFTVEAPVGQFAAPLRRAAVSPAIPRAPPAST